MKFWDSSALVQLLVQQGETRRMREVLKSDRDQLVWWGARVECVSALRRLERERLLDGDSVLAALRGLEDLARDWNEIHPGERIRDTAIRFLHVHALKAADALQLAAAFVACDGQPGRLEFLSLDARLVDAARREGFRIPA